MNKDKVLNRGFSSVIEEVCKKSRFLKSCTCCDYFYAAENEEEELCQNPNVTHYDIVVTDNDSHCAFWSLYSNDYTPKGSKKKETKTKQSLDDILFSKARQR